MLDGDVFQDGSEDVVCVYIAIWSLVNDEATKGEKKRTVRLVASLQRRFSGLGNDVHIHRQRLQKQHILLSCCSLG